MRQVVRREEQPLGFSSRSLVHLRKTEIDPLLVDQLLKAPSCREWDNGRPTDGAQELQAFLSRLQGGELDPYAYRREFLPRLSHERLPLYGVGRPVLLPAEPPLAIARLEDTNSGPAIRRKGFSVQVARSAISKRPSGPVTTSWASWNLPPAQPPTLDVYLIQEASTTTPSSGCPASASTTCAFHGPAASAAGGAAAASTPMRTTIPAFRRPTATPPFAQNASMRQTPSVSTAKRTPTESGRPAAARRTR